MIIDERGTRGFEVNDLTAAEYREMTSRELIKERRAHYRTLHVEHFIGPGGPRADIVRICGRLLNHIGRELGRRGV
jgi:hypothetical protein